MAKNKHKQHGATMAATGSHTPAQDYQADAESAVVRKDTLETIIVNVFFIAVLLGLYYWNQSSHVLDNWIGRIFGA